VILFSLARDVRAADRATYRSFSFRNGMLRIRMPFAANTALATAGPHRPDEFARVKRLKHSYQRWNAGAAALTNRRAHLEGYYDESHFDREFRRFTGASPFARLRDTASSTTITDHLLHAG
jgi:hypothetical protein